MALVHILPDIYQIVGLVKWVYVYHLNSEFLNYLIFRFCVLNDSLTYWQVGANWTLEFLEMRLINHEVDIKIKLYWASRWWIASIRWGNYPRQYHSQVTLGWVWLHDQSSCHVGGRQKVNACISQVLRLWWLHNCFYELWAQLLVRHCNLAILIREDSDKVWRLWRVHLGDINGDILLLQRC